MDVVRVRQAAYNSWLAYGRAVGLSFGAGAPVAGDSGGEKELMYLVPITVEINDKCVIRVSVGEPDDDGEGQREDGP
eukprot:15985-Eustigmatos_ZCMA.PRE.1